jgi:TM2 domain-containing membrane protein YozV
MKYFQKKKRNDKGKNNKFASSDDDEVTIRMRVREVVEGKAVTTLMTAVTLFALFGDDFRLWFFDSWVDPYFYSLLILCFFIFGLEILLNSCVVDDFKYSFFFWLDIVATLSLIVDIAWLVQLIEYVFNSSSSGASADVKLGEVPSDSADTDVFVKIIKSLRLIRLIRIIKLYKYVV